MTHARADTVASPVNFSTKLKGWLVWERGQLNPRNRHFWIILALVLLLAVVHGSVEIGALFHLTRPLVIVPFSVPTSLFLVPVIYAALVFGLRGALATAFLATISAIPNWVFFHYGWGRFACMFQLAIVDTAAFFVGQRVELERRALRQAEAAAAALEISRGEYAHLLESSPTAVLVMGLNGTILKANKAARLLFSREDSDMEGVHIAELVGMAGAQKLLTAARGGAGAAPLALKLKDGRALSIEPTLTEAGNKQGSSIILAVFRDVTEEYGRQANLKAYAVSVMRALEEERQMIARELHDETIQELALLSRRLMSIEDSKLLPLSMADDVREARRLTDEAAKGLRDFTRRLRPPILDDLGIVAAISRTLADFSERTGVKGAFNLVGEDRRLAADTELAMFRTAQEALRNVEQHARATRVSVSMTFADNLAVLEIADNGVGFSVPAATAGFEASSHGHLGLISMQERAESVGGKLEVRSTPAEGTRVTVSFPASNRGG